MVEMRQNSRGNENLELTRRMRLLVKTYHQESGDIKDDKTELISRLLSECFDARRKKEVDHWPVKWASNETILLAGKAQDGAVKRAPYRIALPVSPRAFVNTLWEFLEEERLPPEAPVDPTMREKAEREPQKKSQKETGEKAEQQEKERAERDARKPENVFGGGIKNAKTLDDFREILKDMDDAFDNQSARGPDQAFPEETYADLRFTVIPKRVAELYRTETANAQKPDQLRRIFRNIVQDGFFREKGHREMLSQDGESLLSNVYTHAGLYFKGVIQAAKFRNELADIGKEIERFFGGSLREAEVLKPTVIRGRLSQSERSKLTTEQIQRYELGENAAFVGLLSESEKEEILTDRNIAFFGPSQEEIRQVVADLAGEIEQQKVRLRPLAKAA